jgi:molybdopterin synthase catalytic subunit
MKQHGGVYQKGSLNLSDLVDALKKEPDFKKAGAIAVFIGVVRSESEEGDRVEELELQAYDEKANQTLNQICDDLQKKPGITDVQIHHLLGNFSPNEDMVYVLVAGSHRQNTFSVLEEAVERYKKEAPIFKKEHVVTSKGEKKAYWTSERK